VSLFARLIDAVAEVWLVALAILVVVVALVGLRRFGLAAGLFAAALFALAVYKRLATPPMPDVEVMRRNPPATPGSILNRVPVELVDGDIAITGGGAPFTFAGTVTNRSNEYIVTSITVQARRLDCYEAAIDPSGCDVLWQREKWIDVRVPPQESRRFSVSDWARDTQPRPKGAVRDEISIVRAGGRSLPR
jgi:hypothetical protein